MSFRGFAVVCAVVGHKRNAASRRNANGSLFAACQRCGRELYRDPLRGVWRAATEQDRHPRGFAIVKPGAPTVAEALPSDTADA